jgi:hypothetical protein
MLKYVGFPLGFSAIWRTCPEPKKHFYLCLLQQLCYRTVEYSLEGELFEVGGALFPEDPLARSLKGAP